MRRALVKVHLWLGLTVGLFWALQGLTGALLVFHREVDRLAGPAAVADGAMLSLDTLIAKAQAVTHAPVDRIDLVNARSDLLGAVYRSADGEPHMLLLDAATGVPVGERELEPSSPLTGSATRWLYLLHETLLAGERGEIFIGTSGVVLLSSVLMGLWIGWPKRQAWAAAFSASRWHSLPQKLYGWHRAIGLTVGIVLTLTIPGGIYIVFSKPIRATLATVVPHELSYKPAPADEPVTPAVSAQAAFDLAQTRFPDASFVRLTMPSAKAPVYAVRLLQPGEVRAWSGTTTVTIDAASGRVAHIYDAISAPISNRIVDALFSIHNGEIAGLGGRLLVMLAGLSLPIFYVTGVWLWLSKRRRKAKPVAVAPVAAE